MTAMKRTFLAILFFGSVLAACSQEEIHRIASLEFQVKGMTSEAALRSQTDLREGLEFPSREALTGFLERQKQNLINGRVFDRVEYRDFARSP